MQDIFIPACRSERIWPIKTGMLWLVLQGMGHCAHVICSWHSLYKQQLQKQHNILRWLQVLQLSLTFNPSLILLHPTSLRQVYLYDDRACMHAHTLWTGQADLMDSVTDHSFICYTFIKSIQGSTTKFMRTCNRTMK